MSKAQSERIERLVELHGEKGLCPTRSDWAEILACPEDEPLNILNLLRFQPEVQTGTGLLTGMEAYANYSAGVGPAFLRAGGKSLYFGKVNHIFGTVEGTDWHAAILTRYPSPAALANFWLDDEFVEAHAHRASGVESSRVLVMNGLRAA